MGAVESKAEENSVTRFVDSVGVRHEKGSAVHEDDGMSTDKGKGSWSLIHNQRNYPNYN